MIVLDASAAVLGLLHDGDARRSLATEPVAVPHLVDAEIAQALHSLVEHEAVDEGTAGRALDRWARLGVQRFATVGLLRRMWALRGDVSANDATYVALAEALECELVTADGRLARAAGPTCPITVLRT